LDYSLKHWEALTRCVDDGAVPIDNNWMENRIWPWTLGLSSWMFSGSICSGQRASAVMTLIQSAELNGEDLCAYQRDVLPQLSAQKNNSIGDLLPNNGKPATPDTV